MVRFPQTARQIPASHSLPHPTDAHPSLSGGARGLLVALDTLELPFAFIGRAGDLQHASSAFRRAMESEGCAAPWSEILRFAAAVWGMANVRRLGEVIEPLDERSMPLPCGVCSVRGTYVGADLFGAGASVLIAVRVPAADPCSCEELRQRFGLTRKQSRVARLLVEGLRNDEIARRLFISPHTARHHVEQVRLKVGGHTRAAVAARIRQRDTSV